MLREFLIDETGLIGGTAYREGLQAMKPQDMTFAKAMREAQKANDPFSNLGLTGTTSTTSRITPTITDYAAKNQALLDSAGIKDTRTTAEKQAVSDATAKEFATKSTSIWDSIINDPTWQKEKQEILGIQAQNAAQYAQQQAQQQQAQNNQQDYGTNVQLGAPQDMGGKNNTVLYIILGVVVVGGILAVVLMGGNKQAVATPT